jgi:hypothetical protein
MRRRWSVPVALAVVLGGAPGALASTPREWRFDVFLGDKAIGTQVYRVTAEGPRERVRTEAAFDVNFLFVNAYSYRHRDEEVWERGCLASIESTTDDNGKPYRLTGTSASDGFAIQTQASRATLPDCVRTFAYWNPEYLKAQRLLNAQTGEYENVTLRPLGEETVEVRGERRPARRYALVGPTMRIDLWYSPDNDWLALESKKGSRTIRYVRH